MIKKFIEFIKESPDHPYDNNIGWMYPTAYAFGYLDGNFIYIV